MKLNYLAFATVGTLAFSPVANASLIPNGSELNGIHMNGLTLNGIHMNGISRQGTQLNGLTLNGIHMNGISRQGTQLNRLTANGQAVQSTPSKTNQQTGLTLSSPQFATIKVEAGRLVGVVPVVVTKSAGQLMDGPVSTNGTSLDGIVKQ